MKATNASFTFMQECAACGLLFGGSDNCPSCGSRIASEVEADSVGVQSAPDGPLPGEVALEDALEGVPDAVSSKTQQVDNSLPFGMGGEGQMVGSSALPFGLGAPMRVAIEIPSDIPQRKAEPDHATEWEDVIDAPAQEESPAPSIEPIEPIAPPTSAEVAPVPVVESAPAPAPEPVQVSVEASDDLSLHARLLEEETVLPAPVIEEVAAVPSDTFQINAGAFDTDSVFSVEEEVVFHDFGDELQVSEVMVDFDVLADPAEQTVSFDPEALSEGEPELMPARAMPIDDGGNAEVASSIMSGFESLQNGRWKDAADSFRVVCEHLPGDSAALNNFGLALLQQGIQIHDESPTATPAEEPHFETSVLALRQAAQQDRHDPTVMYNLATALASCSRHGVALKIWDAAAVLAPDDAAPLNGKGVSLMAIGEFDSAATHLAAADTLSPSNPIIRRNLSRVRPVG